MTKEQYDNLTNRDIVFVSKTWAPPFCESFLVDAKADGYLMLKGTLYHFDNVFLDSKAAQAHALSVLSIQSSMSAQLAEQCEAAIGDGDGLFKRLADRMTEGA